MTSLLNQRLGRRLFEVHRYLDARSSQLQCDGRRNLNCLAIMGLALTLHCGV